jgi:hypothetical protein
MWLKRGKIWMIKKEKKECDVDIKGIGMIYTSYFGSKKWDINNSVSIARKTPDYVNVPIYLKLAPPFELVKEYKQDYDQSKYVLRYSIEVLSHLNPQKVLEELDGKTLLCYEKSGDFCHRHIVGKWLNIYTGIDIKEL